MSSVQGKSYMIYISPEGLSNIIERSNTYDIYVYDQIYTFYHKINPEKRENNL